MRWTIGCLAALAVGGAAADDTKPPAAAAKVVVSGKTSGLIFVRVTTGGETKKLRVRLVELGDQTTLAVALPADPAEPPAKAGKDAGVDPDLKRLLNEAAGATAEVAAEGRLSSTASEVVAAAVGGKGSKSVPLLMADRVIDLTAANAKDFPPRGSVRVEGALTRSTIKVGRETADWAVRNADSEDIPLLLAAGAAVPDAGSRVRVSGAVKVVEGRFVVVAKTVDAIK